jgi:hypothetical protein
MADSGRLNDAIEGISATVIPKQIADLPVGRGLAAQLARLKAMFQVADLPHTERHAALQNWLMIEPVGMLVCAFAAKLGHQDLVYERLLPAAEQKKITGGAGSRWFTARALFWQPNSALRSDPRFAKVCAHLGLVDYWRESGRWPDCADEVPYDFKAECEKVHDVRS